MSYLRGRLEIFIDQAENLTNTETSCCGRGDASDPYVTGKLGDDKSDVSGSWFDVGFGTLSPAK